MDDVRQAAAETGNDLQVLADGLAEATDGVTLAYRLLDRLAERHGIADACLVVHPEGLGPQVFTRGAHLATADRLRDLLGQPPGIYGADRNGRAAEPALGGAVAACCALALAAQLRPTSTALGGRRDLGGRPATEAVLARTVSRSARHGWPVTALLLRLSTGASPADRRRALLAAVAAVARAGDDIGDAGGAGVMVVLSGAGGEMAAAFVRRLERELSSAGIEDGAVQWATVRVPDETVDPEEVWRLAGERLAGERPAGEGPTVPSGQLADWTGAVPADLELELRALTGVVAVGTAGRGVGGGPQVVVIAEDPSQQLHAEVTRRIAERFGEAAVPVVTIGTQGVVSPAPRLALNAAVMDARASPAPAMRERCVTTYPPSSTNGDAGRVPSHAGVPRVTLVAATYERSTGVTEVTVGQGAAFATGRATTGPLEGAAQATLAALSVLGFDVPFSVVSVERSKSMPGEPVVSILRSHDVRHSGDGMPAHRLPAAPMGVASGIQEVEASSKATLAALNRYLGLSPTPTPT